MNTSLLEQILAFVKIEKNNANTTYNIIENIPKSIVSQIGTNLYQLNEKKNILEQLPINNLQCNIIIDKNSLCCSNATHYCKKNNGRIIPLCWKHAFTLMQT